MHKEVPARRRDRDERSLGGADGIRDEGRGLPEADALA